MAFNVPVPVVMGESTTSVVLGFRVVNQLDNAGLLVAAQVNYEDGRDPDVFYTGLDQTWIGERLFQEHWEQPWFDPDAQANRSWRPARVYTAAQLSPAIPSLDAHQEIVVMGALPATDGGASQQGSTPSPTSDLCSGSACNQGIGLSKGGFAGVLVGSIVLAFLFGSALSFLLTRRRYRSPGTPSVNFSTFWASSSHPQSPYIPPATKPGRALSSVALG